jgi:hypothetical protein
MPLTTGLDAAAAIDAVRTQRAAASRALLELELYHRLEPRGECLADWAGPASAGYDSDLAALRSLLAGVRSTLRDAVDGLSRVLAEVGDD